MNINISVAMEQTGVDNAPGISSNYMCETSNL